MNIDFNTENITVALAPAGCGKTHYLRDKVTEALETYRPEEVAYVSFTRMGANQGKSVIMKHLGIEEESLPFFSTLHALTFNALGLKHKNIFSIKHLKNFNELLGFNLSLNSDMDSNTHDDKLLNYYDNTRSGCVLQSDTYEKFDYRKYKRFVNAYEHYKKQNGLIDFMDCLLKFVERGKPIPVRFACIDEAQDLTSLQWMVCTTAFSTCERIFIAGDDYQSIYQYAGAKPDYLIALSKKYSTVNLEVSYRLPVKVCSLSKGITGLIAEKVDKDYESYKDMQGSITHLNDVLLLSSIIESKRDETWLFLFRNNFFTTRIEEILQDRLIPYSNNNGFFINERTLSKINTFYNFRKRGFLNEESKNSFMKKYGITDITCDLSETNIVEGDFKYVVQAYLTKYGLKNLIREAKTEPKIRVSSIHRAKGAEAKNVAVFMDCTRRVSKTLYEDLDSELRLLYVACTRAEENLYLVQSESSFGLDSLMNTIMEEYNA